MKSKSNIRTILTILIAAVWMINGLFCKLLNFVPRHQQIVAEILGWQHARLFTAAIGLSEILMAVWIVSGIKPRLCTIAQIIIVATMNTIEFMMVPDLLLFGRMNAMVALFFMLVVYCNEFVLNKQTLQTA
jgi:uncharacterized membrane protein YphA (DoxX/SURF4 family)